MSRLDVLTWNLFHGRAVPPAGRPLLSEFAAALAGWEWDVALLQEVPPWWTGPLARACEAQGRFVLTSRNALLPVRRFVADRRPDLIRSNGGGANAILVRGTRIEGHGRRRLCLHPERRLMHAVLLADGPLVANLHASVPGTGRGPGEVEEARLTALRWAGDRPVVLGGDLNLSRPVVPGFDHVAGHHVDHVWARGLAAEGKQRLPDRGTLSDHAPLAVALSTGR